MSFRRIQDQDVKGTADVASDSQLINDTKIYVTADSINKRLDQAITDGDIGGGGGASDAADLTYTPADNTDWDGDVDPGNGDAAFDQLAERAKRLEGQLLTTPENFNYITNYGAEENSTGWTLYNNTTAGPKPDDFGGSTNTAIFNFTRSIADPLVGIASFNIDKATAGSSAEGYGAYYEFDMDEGHKGRMFLFSAVTDLSELGNEELSIWAVGSNDSFASDFEYISPSNPDVNTTNSIYKQMQLGQKAKYRLCIHSNGMGTTTVKDAWLDQIFFGPIGVLSSSEEGIVAARIKLSGGASHTANGAYQKVPLDGSDFVEGMTHDTANDRLIAITAGYYQVNVGVAFTSITNAAVIAPAIYKNGSQTTVGVGIPNGGTGSTQAQAVDLYYLEKDDYIEAWVFQNDSASEPYQTSGARTFMSVHKVRTPEAATTLSQSEVFTNVYNVTPTQTTIGSSYGASTSLIFGSVTNDDTGSYNTSTGVWTCPESGTYDFYANTFVGGTEANNDFVGIYVGINGVSSYQPFDRVYNSGVISSKAECSGSFKLEKGDTVDFRVTSNIAGAGIVGTALNHSMFIRKNSNPQSLLETETIAEAYTTNAGQTMSTGVTTIVFEDALAGNKSFNYDTSTGDFNVSVSGYYELYARITATANIAVGETISLRFYLNGSVADEHRYESDGTNSSSGNSHQVIFGGYLEKGDVINARLNNGSGASFNLPTTSYFHKLSIKRVK